MHARRDVDGALVARAGDRDEHGRLAVETGELVRLGKAVDDLGDVAEADARPVGARQEHEILVLRAPIRLPLRAEQNLAGFGPNRAAGQVER